MNLPTLYRKRIEVYIVMPDRRLLVCKLPSGDYLGPGGGIESNQTMAQAAYTECLEELGAEIKDLNVLNPTNPFMRDFYTKDAGITTKSIKRKEKYRGAEIYYGYAKFVTFNNSLYDRDGDALPSTIVTKQELIKMKNKFINSFDPELAKFQLKMIKLIPV